MVAVADALRGVSRLFIETSPFIYFIEKNPIYIQRLRSIFLALDKGNFTGFTSVITIPEVLPPPLRTRNTA